MATPYSTIVAASTYHTDRGNTTWTGTDGAKNVALLRGSEYVDQMFRSSFPGYKTEQRAQEREWPRADAYDVDGNYLDPEVVPDEVFRATYEAALRELVSPGSLLPDYIPSAQRKRVKVDVIEVEYTTPPGASSSLPVINIIRNILQPILTGTTSTSIAGTSVRV